MPYYTTPRTSRPEIKRYTDKYRKVGARLIVWRRVIASVSLTTNTADRRPPRIATEEARSRRARGAVEELAEGYADLASSTYATLLPMLMQLTSPRTLRRHLLNTSRVLYYAMSCEQLTRSELSAAKKRKAAAQVAPDAQSVFASLEKKESEGREEKEPSKKAKKGDGEEEDKDKDKDGDEEQVEDEDADADVNEEWYNEFQVRRVGPCVTVCVRGDLGVLCGGHEASGHSPGRQDDDDGGGDDDGGDVEPTY